MSTPSSYRHVIVKGVAVRREVRKRVDYLGRHNYTGSKGRRHVRNIQRIVLRMFLKESQP